MNLRGSGGKATTVAIAAGVAAAEIASIVYYMFSPWFLQPDSRAIETSAACNVVLFLVLNSIVERYWHWKKWQDALQLSARITLIYVMIQTPYLISWWNPMTYIRLVGPSAHAFIQLASMALSMWYIKNK